MCLIPSLVDCFMIFMFFLGGFIPNPMDAQSSQWFLVPIQEPRPRRQTGAVPGPDVGQVGHAPMFLVAAPETCRKDGTL